MVNVTVKVMKGGVPAAGMRVICTAWQRPTGTSRLLCTDKNGLLSFEARMADKLVLTLDKGISITLGEIPATGDPAATGFIWQLPGRHGSQGNWPSS